MDFKRHTFSTVMAWLLAVVILVLIAAAILYGYSVRRPTDDNHPLTSAYRWRLPSGFPLPYVPVDNPMSEAKARLGRYLFYDVRLSGNGTQACSSCHQQALAFTDGRRQAVGSTGAAHPRNAMSLTNVAYNPSYNWANPTLHSIEQQIQLPLFGNHPVEMGITGSETLVLARFQEDSTYRRLFADAFPPPSDPITFRNITLALATFTRTLISGSSPYDAFLRGNSDAISPAAQRGMRLFASERLPCQNCHMGFNLTIAAATADWSFDTYFFSNIGLYNVQATGAYPANNTGVFEHTGDAQDMGAFRPPTLRNIALTAPYMHDGSIATLQDVIRHYAMGGRGVGQANPYKSILIRPFQHS